MTTHYPTHVDARRMARQATEDSVEISLDGLPRLKEMGGEVGQPLRCSLKFSEDQGGTAYLNAHLLGEIQVPCQRCLSLMAVPVDDEVTFVLLRDAEKEVPAGMEPAVLSEDGLNVLELLEDELLLQVPLSPMHENLDHCDRFIVQAEELGNEVEVEGAEDRRNPFAVLAALKGSDTK